MEAGGKGVIDVRGAIGLEKFYEEHYGIEASGTVTEFERAIKDLGEVREIELNIYSPGGEVFAALAMHNILVRHPAKVTAHIDGLAASAATILMLAADEIRMPENAYVMIHNATMFAMGDHRDLSAAADQLRKWSRDMAGLYTARIEDNIGGDRAEILSDVIAKMDAETWLTGAEAKALGLVETVTSRVELAACVGGPLPAPMLSGLHRDRVPEALRPLLFDNSERDMSTPAAPPVEAAPVAPVLSDAPAAEPIAPSASAESDKSDLSDAAPAAVVEPSAPVAPAPAAVTLDAIKDVVASAVQPLADRLATAEAALANEQQLRASGVPQNAWGNQQAADIPSGDGAPTKPEFASLSASEKIRLGRQQMHPNAPGNA